jgi:hypothetical protein
MTEKKTEIIGDGVDRGITSGEQYWHFVYWAVTRHPRDKFSDEEVMALLRAEFPHRKDRTKWPNKKWRTFQAIAEHRNYARTPFGTMHKLGIRSEAHAKEVLRRIDSKLRGVVSNAGQEPPSAKRSGAGFGTPESNPAVENAAIVAVTRLYERKGWHVEDVSALKLGFDLRCRKGRQIEEVEVKGVTGIDEGFIITANEVRQAEVNERFVLCVVTNAMSHSSKVTRYVGSEFAKEFTLRPLQYVAKRNVGARVKR